MRSGVLDDRRAEGAIAACCRDRSGDPLDRRFAYGLAGRGVTRAAPSATLRPLETMTGINAPGAAIV
jgi:hypothetical protein